METQEMAKHKIWTLPRRRDPTAIEESHAVEKWVTERENEHGRDQVVSSS